MGFPKALRKYKFALCHAQCEGCGRRWDDGYMLYCHHKQPVMEGGSDKLENCEMLCRDCHAKRHQHLANTYKRSGNDKLANKNAFACRTIKRSHNLMRK